MVDFVPLPDFPHVLVFNFLSILLFPYVVLSIFIYDP